MDCAQDGKKDGMISTNADCSCACVGDFIQLAGDASVGVIKREGIDGEISVIGDAPLREWINVEHRIPRANDGALLAHAARSETRSGTVGRSSVERNSDERDIEFLWTRNVRQAHERGDSGESRVDERVDRLGTRSWKFPGFYFLGFCSGLLRALTHGREL
jgi:hypothetical protein